MPFINHPDWKDPYCVICGGEPGSHHGVPTFNGDVVSNDFACANGTQPACGRCYHLHAHGMVPVHDSRYLSDRARWWSGFAAGMFVAFLAGVIFLGLVIARRINSGEISTPPVRGAKP
jgi:hypothetical protein